jgi:crossover junction endodeoxyribonuclease RuvC
MFVLGIDPGLSRCGYGLVQAGGPDGKSRGQSHQCVSYGVLTTPHTDPIHFRLASLMDQLQELFDRTQPHVVVVERVFFQNNARTAMGVGQASGLALALATKRGAQVFQYTSNEVKQAVAGYGAAEKYQMQEMVARLLQLPAPPKPADAADALGLALCHLAHAPLAIAAAGAQSVGRSIDPGPAGAFGGRPLRIATSVGGVNLAPTAAVAKKKEPVA